MTKNLKSSWMKAAIQAAEKGMRKGEGGPFGACIVKGNKILAAAHNEVLKKDATCHAEINAIRAVSRKIKNFDLSGCEIYTTTEPCPMCFAAIHWARIKRVVYGTRIGDVAKRGFNELSISSGAMKKKGKSSVKIEAGFLRADCLELLGEWDRLPGRQVY